LTPDGDWQLVSGVPLLDGYPITLSIAGSEAGGRAACNSYGASVAVAGDTITFGELSGTEMGCEPDVMGAERAFLTSLQQVDSFALSGERLTLTGRGRVLVFAAATAVPTADLVDTRWVLDTLIEGETASTAAGEPAELLLSSDGTLTASTGCRTLTGTWQENGAVVVIPTLSADGECPAELARQDSLVVTVIGDEFRPTIEGDRLTLTSMGNDGLVYRTAG
jgi:heat shock protein HslJ